MSIEKQVGLESYANGRPRSPTITILDQPKQRGLRFRYKCEGRSAGSIPGENSSTDRKTYPTIKINNCEGSSAVVVVSCVTKDPPYMPHPHNLVGQDCQDGVCTVKVKNLRSEIAFPNIGIQCCKRHDIEENLKMRENMLVNPFSTGFPTSLGNIDLNAVRLCFQAFLPDVNKKYTRILRPIVSQPIIDKKSVHDLVICRLSKQSGCVQGGEEVFLLCEKINKDDIKVRFFQELSNGEVWEAEGEFTANDVHRQYAIVFKTPQYHDLSISDSTTVFIQLQRPSDNELGDPKPFLYIPQDPDPYGLVAKRRKKSMTSSSNHMTTTPIHPSPQIPRTVMDEMNQEEGEQEVNANLNGISFVKDKLKKKIENKTPDIPEALHHSLQFDDVTNKRFLPNAHLNGREGIQPEINNNNNSSNNLYRHNSTNNSNFNTNTYLYLNGNSINTNNINNSSNGSFIPSSSNYSNHHGSSGRIEVGAHETIASPVKNDSELFQVELAAAAVAARVGSGTAAGAVTGSFKHEEGNDEKVVGHAY